MLASRLPPQWKKRGTLESQKCNKCADTLRKNVKSQQILIPVSGSEFVFVAIFIFNCRLLLYGKQVHHGLQKLEELVSNINDIIENRQDCPSRFNYLKYYM